MPGPCPITYRIVEAVEREGWALIQWAGSTDQKGNPQGYPVFRRR